MDPPRPIMFFKVFFSKFFIAIINNHKKKVFRCHISWFSGGFPKILGTSLLPNESTSNPVSIPS